MTPLTEEEFERLRATQRRMSRELDWLLAGRGKPAPLTPAEIEHRRQAIEKAST